MKQDFDYVGRSYYSKPMRAYLHVMDVCSDNYEKTEREKEVKVLYVREEENVLEDSVLLMMFLDKVSYCKEISNEEFLAVYDKVLHFFEEKRMRIEEIKVKPLKLEGENNGE